MSGLCAEVPPADAVKVSSARLVAVLSVANFAIGMGAFVVIGLIEPIASDLGVGPASAGTVLTTYALAYAVLSPLAVALTGRMGRRRLLGIALGLFALGALASALSTSLAMLNAARVIAALGAGMVTPVVASIALATAAPGSEGRTLARVFFGLTLAQVLGVPVGSWIGYSVGWQSAFVIVAALSGVAAIAVLNVVPRRLSLQVNTLATLGEALADWRSLVAVLFTASYLGAVFVLYTYAGPLLSEVQGYDRNGVTLVLFMFGIGAVIGNNVGGWLNDRFGSRRTLMMTCLSQVLLLPLFALLPMPDALLMLLALVWSMCGWSFMVAQQTRLVAQTPARQNVVLSLNAAAIYIGTAVGSAIGGALIPRVGLDSLGWWAGGFAILALLHLMLSERLFRPSTMTKEVAS